MVRTRRRPLPAHAVAPEDALVFGLVLTVISFALLAVTTNLVAAFLTLLAIGFYVVVYTMLLKRTTPQNIVLGGAAGALPPVIGWAAVTGDITLPALLLFAIVFYWTPPHFWALSLRIRGDYEAAGVPMMPVTHGVPETTRQIALYSILMVALTLVFFAVAQMGLLFLAGALVLGGDVPVPGVRDVARGHRPARREAVQVLHHLPVGAVRADHPGRRAFFRAPEPHGAAALAGRAGARRGRGRGGTLQTAPGVVLAVHERRAWPAVERVHAAHRPMAVSSLRHDATRFEWTASRPSTSRSTGPWPSRSGHVPVRRPNRVVKLEDAGRVGRHAVAAERGPATLPGAAASFG